MKVNGISSLQNYKQNFGMKIGDKALVSISDQIGNDRTKLFSNTPDVLSTIKKSGSEKVEMAEFTANKEYGYRGYFDGYSVDFKLKYTLGDMTYSHEYSSGDSYGDCWYPSRKVPHPIINDHHENILNIALNTAHSELIACVIESLAQKGELKNNLDKIIADFPNDKKLIQQKYEIFKGLDEEAPRLLEIEKNKNIEYRLRRIKRQEEYRKRHPILCRLFGNKY
ncbi:MAG: hypothetical protein MJ180_01060 [Candidatus Gastranaerophilales bacterium]|nr:hypothetical protein [Candidatus Gastranaerophilales bacterium]